ncbi:CHRD domain-containing protein [Thermus sediminis]|uniref:CHRD domain-containing protein n=1 Tax=Thermus sediminis TaxID=1761908 RepID=UPI000E3DA339|nr:CHRD domain-containing protein [Thermus sediminis]
MRRRQFLALAALALPALTRSQAQATPAVVRSVVLTGKEVVPNPTPSPAVAVVSLRVEGRVLDILGAVANLQGPFRDYRLDPVDDPALNARLTSAVHLHRGPRGANGPLLQALRVEPGPDGRSAAFRDRIELGLEDLARLRRGELYFDIHTTAFRGGEVRGQILI